MNTSLNVCAHDLGGSSGKMFIGSFDGKRIALTQVYHYPFGPICTGQDFYWNIPDVVNHVLNGLRRAGAKCPDLKAFASTGFGNVFVLLDRHGRFFTPSFASYSARMKNVEKDLFSRFSKKSLHMRTGTEINQNQMLMMLNAYRLNGDQWLLENAEHVVLHVDALKYFLCGELASERTAAGITGLYSASQHNWDKTLAELVCLSVNQLPAIVEPCTVSGVLSNACSELTDCNPRLQIINAPQHDTAAACFALPTTEEMPAFMILGTFALCGIETNTPIINKYTFTASIGNEANPFGKNKLLCSARAMWFLDRCLQALPEACSYAHAVDLAACEPALRFIIDLNDRERFVESAPMPEQIVLYLQETGQGHVERFSQILRCIFDSIACFAFESFRQLEIASGTNIMRIFAINGGAQNKLIMQTVANITGKPVFAGNFNASSMGVVLSELSVLGELKSLTEIREVAGNSTSLLPYYPELCSYRERAEELLRIIRTANYQQTE